MTNHTLAIVIEASAVLVSAVSGMIVASQKRLDLVGTYMLAVVTAFGGGTLRDVLLDRRPLFWVIHEEYLLIILGLCLAFVYSPRLYQLARTLDKRGEIVDALGLGLFSLTGVGFALQAGMPLFVVALFGVITGTFGGVLRDVMISEIPQIFRPGALYAVPAFLGSCVYLGALRIGAPAVIAETLGFGAIVTLRLLSIYHRDFTLPLPHWLRS